MAAIRNNTRSWIFLNMLILAALFLSVLRPVGVSAAPVESSLLAGQILSFNTFLGGSQNQYPNAMARDGSGNLYIAGWSNQSWGSPIRPFGGVEDAFAAKISGNGSLQWLTFLGGAAYDEAFDIDVDSNGNAYVIGKSDASWGSPIQPFAGRFDAFIAKLNTDGVLQWNTFVGGASEGQGLTVDNFGNIYVAGYSNSTWGSPVNPKPGGTDIFAGKFNTNGTLQWNTFLGSSGNEFGADIARDGAGNIFVIGLGYASWGTPVNGYVGASDVFAAKLDSTGVLQWNTFMGGTGYDFSNRVAVDGSGNPYITGTSETTWATPVRPYTGGTADGFAAKLNGANGTGVWNTFLGGTDFDGPNALRVLTDGTVYLTGISAASWGTPMIPFHGSGEVFAASLNNSGTLQWNSFLGGAGGDYGTGLALDQNSAIYIAGGSNATWGSPLHAYSGGTDNFIAKISVTQSAALRSQGALDGWVLESNELSNVGGTMNAIGPYLVVGDNAADWQYRSVLSFDTAGLPDNAIITKATLRIKRQGIVGTDPFSTHGGLKVDIRKPYFGATAGLAPSDFQAGASRLGVATFSKTPAAGYWYPAVLSSTAFPYINLKGATQFRLRFTMDDNDDGAADYIKFYSGNSLTASYRPVLIIQYYVP